MSRNNIYIIKYFLLLFISTLFVVTYFSTDFTFSRGNLWKQNAVIAKTSNFNVAQRGQALTEDEVDSVASQTTVVIAPDLHKEDIDDPSMLDSSGSGFIIGKIGKTYYVATNVHVVKAEGGIYGIYTPYDKKVHKVDDNNPTSKIIRFGKEKPGKVDGFDLAILKFDSKKNYKIAAVEKQSIASGSKVFVSGWPHAKNMTGKMKRHFEKGEVEKIQIPPQSDGGFGLFYSCKTQGGMSGGPVFNTKAKVVGIHGRGDGVQHIGILVDYLIAESKKAQVKGELSQQFAFNFRPPNQNVIEAGLPGKRPKSADVIDNFFKTFNLDFKRSSIRDCPSGGAGSVLLGGEDERCE